MVWMGTLPRKEIPMQQCPLCGETAPLTYEAADPTGTVMVCEPCVTGEPAYCSLDLELIDHL